MTHMTFMWWTTVYRMSAVLWLKHTPSCVGGHTQLANSTIKRLVSVEDCNVCTFYMQNKYVLVCHLRRAIHRTIVLNNKSIRHSNKHHHISSIYPKVKCWYNVYKTYLFCVTKHWRQLSPTATAVIDQWAQINTSV